MTYEEQYLNLLDKLKQEGVWVYNERTGKRCLTIPEYTFTYSTEAPLLTAKQCYPVSAVAEMIGYLRGYTNAIDFENIGTKSWYANANETQSWINNPNRKGDNDMGKVYGAIGRDFGGIDLLDKVYNNLRNDIDDRGEIITFWKPDDFDKGCLRPCMYSHHFTLLGGKLYLNSTQRSGDVPLGIPFNSIQCYFLLHLMAKITGYDVGYCKHHVVTPHIYEDQMEGVEEMLNRQPLSNTAKLRINDWVQSLGDVVDQDLHARAYITVEDYRHLGKINFKMAV